MEERAEERKMNGKSNVVPGEWRTRATVRLIDKIRVGQVAYSGWVTD